MFIGKLLAVSVFVLFAHRLWPLLLVNYKLLDTAVPLFKDRMLSSFFITAPLCTVTLSTVACCLIDAFGSVDLKCIDNFTRFECAVLAAESHSVFVFVVGSAEHHTVSNVKLSWRFGGCFCFPQNWIALFSPSIHNTTYNRIHWPLPGVCCKGILACVFTKQPISGCSRFAYTVHAKDILACAFQPVSFGLIS